MQAYGPIDGQGAVDVRTFGAKGWSQDDTISIQAAIDLLFASGGHVWIPPGTYMVDAVRSIRLNSGSQFAYDTADDFAGAAKFSGMVRRF